MALNISDLVAVTEINDTDILHLRTSGGLDRKITGANVKSVLVPKNSKTVTIQDNINENEIVVLDWGESLYRKASTSFNPWNSFQLLTTVADPPLVASIFLVRLSQNRYAYIYDTTSPPECGISVITTNVDGTISQGTVQTFTDLQSAAVRKVIHVDTDKIVILYEDAAGSDLYARAVSFSGSTVTIGAATLLDSVNTSFDFNGCRVKAGFFVYHHSDTGDNIGRLQLCSLSGTTISKVGSEYNTTKVVAGFDADHLANVRDNVIVYQYEDNAGTGAFLKLYHISDTGTFTPFQETTREIFFPDSGYDTQNTTMFVRNLWEDYFIVFRRVPVGNSVFVFRVPFDGDPVAASLDQVQSYHPRVVHEQLFYGGNNLSSIFLETTTYKPGFYCMQENGLDTNIIFISRKGIFGFIPGWGEDKSGRWQVACTDKYRGLFIGSTVDTSEIYGRTFRGFQKVVGIATESVVAAQSLEVQFKGIKNGFTGLTPEADYYLKEDGTLGADDGTLDNIERLVKIGKAVSTTEIDINIVEPW
jgi:hypothetical protein